MSAEATTQVWGCAKHALIGRTCCQDTEVMLTEGDKARIAGWLGPAASSGFFERAPPIDPRYVDDADPGWLLAFHPDGTRPVLRHKEGGDCTFLGPTGCTLPTAVRPLVCRLHPYTYDGDGLLGVSRGCPAEVVPDGKTLADVVEMNRERAEGWRRQLYDEIREAPRR